MPTELPHDTDNHESPVPHPSGAELPSSGKQFVYLSVRTYKVIKRNVQFVVVLFS